jgi:hypothetical protein
LIFHSPSLQSDSSQHCIVIAYLLFYHDAEDSNLDVVSIWNEASDCDRETEKPLSGVIESSREISKGALLLRAILAHNIEAAMQLLSTIPDLAQDLNFVDQSSGLCITAVAVTARFRSIAQVLLRKGADLHYRQRGTGK